MANFIKNFFIKHNTSVNHRVSGLRFYPKTLNYVGFFCFSDVMPNTNLITILKSTFGIQTQFAIFVFSKNYENSDVEYINMEKIDIFGKFKDAKLIEKISNLDMLIDMTGKQTTLKEFCISMANQAYKITLGAQTHNIYNLSIKLKTFDQSIFAEEIIKYHNILDHVKR